MKWYHTILEWIILIGIVSSCFILGSLFVWSVQPDWFHLTNKLGLNVFWSAVVFCFLSLVGIVLIAFGLLLCKDRLMFYLKYGY